MAFPRTKVAPARPARGLVLRAAARKAERAAVVRSSIELMAAMGMGGAIEAMAVWCADGKTSAEALALGH